MRQNKMVIASSRRVNSGVCSGRAICCSFAREARWPLFYLTKPRNTHLATYCSTVSKDPFLVVGVLVLNWDSGPSSCPYLPNVGEGAFSEVRRYKPRVPDP